MFCTNITAAFQLTLVLQLIWTL